MIILFLKKRYLSTILSLALIFGLFRFYQSEASWNAYLWWTIPFLFILVFVIRIEPIRDIKNVSILGILTLFIAGILTLQQNQPIFSPKIKDLKKISTRIENWIVWPRSAESENLIKESWEISEFEYTVLIPLFPLSNLLEFEEFKQSNNEFGNKSPIKVDQDLWHSSRIFFTVKSGPIRIENSLTKPKILTTNDGFSWGEAVINKTSAKHITLLDKVNVIVSSYGSFHWNKLTNEELDYFSRFFFPNQISLSKYLNDKNYQKEISHLIDSIEGNVIFPVSFEPDTFELEACDMKIINKTENEQIIRFIHKGFYPRVYFMKSQSIEFLNGDPDNVLKPAYSFDGIEQLKEGVVKINPNAKKHLSLYRVQYRYPFKIIQESNERYRSNPDLIK